MQWKLVSKELSELHEHPHNPRCMSEIEYNHLKDSIQKFGLSEKLVINTDNTIIGGHQRKKVLEDLGIKKVDCWVPDTTLTESELYELNVRFNRNHGQWDWDILANFWEPTDLCDWGFTEKELEGLVKEDPQPPPEKKKQCSIEFSFNCSDDLVKFIEELGSAEHLQSTAILCNGKSTIRGLEDLD